MFLVFTLLLAFPFSLNVIVKKGTDARLKCVSLQHIEECSFKNPDGKVFKYEENLNTENGRISCLCKTEEYKTATTCGILVKNIFDKDYGNWSCEVKTRGGVEAVVLPVEEERTRPVDPVGGMKGSKGSKCFDGEFPITANKLLGSVAEWGPVFNVSLELFWTAGGYGSWNVLHLTNWAFNRTHGLPNPPKACKRLRLWTKTGKFDQPGPENNYLKNISELCRGLFVPSIYVYKDRWRRFPHPWKINENIVFVFPHHYMRSKPTDILAMTRFNNEKRIRLANNKITNRWVKLSISLERQLTGYYMWTTDIDGRKEVYGNEHNPLVYKDVQIYLGKEMPLRPIRTNQNPPPSPLPYELHLPHTPVGRRSYLGAAQGKVRNVCVSWDSRRPDDVQEVEKTAL